MTLCISHVAAFALGRFLGKPVGMLHRELPLEYAYFEARLALVTGGPGTALKQIDKSLSVFSRPLTMLGVDKQSATMERSFLLAMRARALAALHRDAEAKSASTEASKACLDAGRQSCDASRLVEYSKRLLKTDWDSGN